MVIISLKGFMLEKQIKVFLIEFIFQYFLFVLFYIGLLRPEFLYNIMLSFI